MKLNITQEQYIQLRQQGKTPEQIASEHAVRDTKQSINSFADKVVDFIPGLRTATSNFASEIARSQTSDPVARAIIESTAPSMKETVGSAVQLGANFIPVGKLAQGITGAATALRAGKAASSIGAVGSGALTGYAFDVGNNLETGQAPGKPGIGTAVGTALPVMGVTANTIIKGLASKTPENRLLALTKEYTTVKRAFEKGAVYETVNGTRTLKKDPISTLIKEKVIPSVQNAKIDTTLSEQQILEKIDVFAKLNQKAIDEATTRGVTVPLVSVKQAILENVKSNAELKASGAVGKTLGKVQSILDDFEISYGQRLPINAVDEIRIAMNRVWNPDEVDAARAIGDAMRRFQYDSVPGSRAILKKEGELMAARDFLRALHGKTVTGGRIGRYFGDLIGAIAGSTTQLPVVGPVVGAMGARAIANRIASSYFSPIGARGARTIQNVIDGAGIQSPGDAFLTTKTGAAVKNYVNDAQVGMSIKDVSQMSNAPQMKFPTSATIDATAATPNAQAITSNIDTILPQEGAVSAPGTKSSKPLKDTNTSNALTDTAVWSRPKTATSGGIKDVPKSLSPLYEEAKKYKSAEEFVKAQGTPVYHGTNVKFDKFDKSKLGVSTGAKSAEKGFWFVDNKDVAKGYGEYASEKPVRDILDQIKIEEKKGNWDKVDELTIKAEEMSAEYADPVVIQAKLNLKNPMVYDAKGKGFLATDKKVNDLIDKAIKNGNDGLIIKNLEDNVYSADIPATHTIVFDDKSILTKSQLLDIWKKANNK